MEPVAARHLPEPIDPAAPPRVLARAAAVVVIVGLFLLLVGAKGAVEASDSSTTTPLLPPEAFLVGWLMSLPLAVVLLSSYAAVGRLRLRRFERRAGFLPRVGRKQLPSTGRTTLFRVEYGSRGDRICLMVARWSHTASLGWRRPEVVEHAWLLADDAIGIGEQRTRLTALAEMLEEQVDDARLDSEGGRLIAEEALAERQSDRQRSHRLAEKFARDSR